MTFADMNSLFLTLNDKAESPYWDPYQIDQILNIAYNTWVRLNYLQYEQSEEAKYKLRVLYGVTPPILGKNIISFVTDIPNARYITGGNLTFKKVCGSEWADGKRVQKVSYPVVNIVPTQNNRIDIEGRDPFNEGTDEDPRIIQSADNTGSPILQIFSTTVPVQVVLRYIRFPQVINFTNAPNTLFEQPDDLAQEIVAMANSDADSIIENFGRAKADEHQIAEKMGG